MRVAFQFRRQVYCVPNSHISLKVSLECFSQPPLWMSTKDLSVRFGEAGVNA